MFVAFVLAQLTKATSTARDARAWAHRAVHLAAAGIGRPLLAPLLHGRGTAASCWKRAVSGLPHCGTLTVRSTPMQTSIRSEDPGIQAVANLATEVVETRSLEICMAPGCTDATGLFPAVNIFMEAQRNWRIFGPLGVCSGEWRARNQSLSFRV
jgi:hypothetical protein